MLSTLWGDIKGYIPKGERDLFKRYVQIKLHGSSLEENRSFSAREGRA